MKLSLSGRRSETSQKKIAGDDPGTPRHSRFEVVKAFERTEYTAIDLDMRIHHIVLSTRTPQRWQDTVYFNARDLQSKGPGCTREALKTWKHQRTYVEAEGDMRSNRKGDKVGRSQSKEGIRDKYEHEYKCRINSELVLRCNAILESCRKSGRRGPIIPHSFIFNHLAGRFEAFHLP